MTIGKTIAATPDFIQQKPNTIVQGAGTLGGLVYGIDEEASGISRSGRPRSSKSNGRPAPHAATAPDTRVQQMTTPRP